MVGKEKNMHNDIMILKGLVDLGFNERQSKVYLALYKKSDANLADLQKLTGIRKDKLSEIMNNLIREGFCSEKTIERRKYFNVTNPKTAIGVSVEKKKKSLENSYKAIEDMYNNAREIKEPFEYIEIFHGNDNIHQQFCKLVKNSKKEILGFTKPPLTCYTPDKRKEQEEVEFDFITRNGIVKSIYEIQDNGNDSSSFNIEEFETAGEKVKISESLPMKMIIFDRSALLIADEEPLIPSNEFRMTLIKQNAIVNAFCALFDFFWQKSYDVKSWKAVKYK